jgi:hypothetical protein
MSRSMSRWMRRSVLPCLLALAGSGCEDDKLSREAMLDPQTCKQCHAGHYEQWSGSMHAYAGDDPVFLAMNARGQRETGGELGDFCVSCHAPIAVREGATTDGLNLPELPQHLKGVTCYFCHSVNAVNGSHNNPLGLADDLTMRAAISDPLENDAHDAAYSPFQDRDRRESADMCGACHDIVTPAGVELERTFSEWKQTQFGNGATQQLTCGNCHMPSEMAPAADFDGVPLREIHDHRWPGVDVALTSFAQMDDQLAAVKAELEGSLITQLCVRPPLADSEIEVTIENAFAGHNFPSGAAQDRRFWVSLEAFEADQPIYSSGVAAAGEAVAELSDPDLWLMRDRLFDAGGAEVHMFWKAASFESELLPQATQPNEAHAVSRSYRIPLASGTPDRVQMRISMRPMGLEVLRDLVDSGDLDAAIVDAMPTFELDTLEWRHDAVGYGCVPADPF